MSDELDSQKYPELFVGIVGPMGVDVDSVTSAVESALRTVGYNSSHVKVTDEMTNHATTVPQPTKTDLFSTIMFKIKYANALCNEHDDPAFLMRVAVDKITQLRKVDGSEEPQVVPRRAFIIRQLKRPDEVKLMRTIYGKQFILISAYGSKDKRLEIIKKKLKLSLPVETSEVDINCKAIDLVLTDEHQDDTSGQHLRDTFHLADVFVDGISREEMKSKIVRFINAFFGKTDLSPTKEEYGMYAAKSAALRSSDLSRQVGAAIFSVDGEVISQGCNEVPKAFGGTYWDSEEPDFRDVKLGDDPNDVHKSEVLRDVLERLGKHGLLSDKAKVFGNAAQIANAITSSPKGIDIDAQRVSGVGCLQGSGIANLTEFGRVVHAEMCAICDAARLGRKIKCAILYVTTFPCHNCTKHILAAGISRVVFMEPYPKSKAHDLHEHEISIEDDTEGKITFVPFMGISPHRYRDVFEKGKRKSGAKANDWYRGDPRPMIDISTDAYLRNEIFEAAKIYGVSE